MPVNNHEKLVSQLETLAASVTILPHGASLPSTMQELFKSGQFNKQPLIIGNNLDEASIFGGCKNITKD